MRKILEASLEAGTLRGTTVTKGENHTEGVSFNGIHLIENFKTSLHHKFRTHYDQNQLFPEVFFVSEELHRSAGHFRYV